MVIWLERGADLHTAQLMPLPLTDSWFSKIQIGFTFLVPDDLGSPGQRAVKWVCVCVCNRNTLVIATSLGDRALEAQACYSLGNTYTLLRQYERSVEYHMRHLHIARELSDRVGEARACWSLGNAYSALQRTDLALHYTTLHLNISRQVLIP